VRQKNKELPAPFLIFLSHIFLSGQAYTTGGLWFRKSVPTSDMKYEIWQIIATSSLR